MEESIRQVVISFVNGNSRLFTSHDFINKLILEDRNTYDEVLRLFHGRTLFRMTGILFFCMTVIVVFCPIVFIWRSQHSSADHFLQSHVGRALQGFTSSALLHNTVALPIPNAGFLFQYAQFWTNWEDKLAYLKKK